MYIHAHVYVYVSNVGIVVCMCALHFSIWCMCTSICCFAENEAVYYMYPAFQFSRLGIWCPALFVCVFVCWSVCVGCGWAGFLSLSWLVCYTHVFPCTLYSGAFYRTPWNDDTFGCTKHPVCMCTPQPLKSGHLTNQDTVFCPKGVQIRDTDMYVPLYHTAQ